MAQTPRQQRASNAVAAELAHRGWNVADLKFKSGVDYGTLTDFLNGNRWPRTKTQGAIEKALGWGPGTIREIALGGQVPSPGGETDARAPETVGGETQDEDVFEIKMRRPEGVSVEEWKRMKADWEAELRFKLDRAARER